MNSASTDQTCATCAHWKQDSGEWVGYPRFKMKTADEDWEEWDTRRETWETEAQALYGECNGVEFAPEGETPLAFVIDGSSHSAGLYSQAGFSCALWKPSQ